MSHIVFLRRQSGFAYIAAVVLLVVVAGLAVALLRLTDAQQTTVNQAVLAARASLAARAGIEWAFHRPAERCTETQQATPHHLTDFRNESGFLVTVRCTFHTYNEGEKPGAEGTALAKRIYRIEAVACNGSGTECPDNGSVTRPDYVERSRVATMCMMNVNDFCT